MKKVLLFVSVLFCFSFSGAHADLEEPMKVIGEQFKILARGVQTKEMDDSHLVAIETMQKEIANSALIYPHLATTDELKLQYSQWMAEFMKMALTMEEQIEAVIGQDPQNLSDVTGTMIEMDKLRKKSHEIFKE